ncbi:MAG: hypothetical protein GY875_13030 [Gammaproteobacteria bacterium]|nr:hypothetical protein [Gammaproteobacteria bacterium]
MIRSCLKSALLLLAICPVGLVAQNPLDAVVESLEREQMTRLAAQQKRPGIHIAAFRSDGCSGGMSQSWVFLADTLPKFVDYAGTQPPWEHCCVAHDRDYWRGETQNGFNKREQSDTQLRACVRTTGEQRGAEIAQTLSLPQQDVVDMINLTSELMYQAVRLGGGPCTGLPWRWGHGWPACSASLEPGNQI